jgi:formylglycine-generating enzyme
MTTEARPDPLDSTGMSVPSPCLVARGGGSVGMTGTLRGMLAGTAFMVAGASCGGRVEEVENDGGGSLEAASGSDAVGMGCCDGTSVDASRDAPAGDTGTTPPSCAPGGPGMTNCGPGGSGTESCCKSLDVSGGTFDRSYDAVTYSDPNYPATISTFRLDRYEVTVGRFRRFVSAVVAGWTPPPGSGRHAYLNAGRGLSATGGGYESGWDSSWGSLASTANAWTANLGGTCGGLYASTWTPNVGGNESQPITCETWFEAYAFCIWDGGFLPSEAEWNYAAAGGGGTAGQRVYPWSTPSTSATIDCTLANFSGCTDPSGVTPGTNNVGTDSPGGDGAFGQADLAGNVAEWTLDWYASPYALPCTDCANLFNASDRVLRGGRFFDQTTALLASDRGNYSPTLRNSSFGLRCGRAP